MITRSMALQVNDAEDGFLSTVADVATVDVSGLRNVSVMLNQIGDVAILDLHSLTTNVDTVIRAVTPGATPSVVFTAGASLQAGTITELNNVVTITFKNGVSTVTDIEALIAQSTLIEVFTAGTGANVLATTDDDFTSTPLALATSTFSLVVEKSLDGTNWTAIDTYDESDMPTGDNKAFEITLSDVNGRPLIVKQVRVTLSAMTGANSFTVLAAGLPIPGYA